MDAINYNRHPVNLNSQSSAYPEKAQKEENTCFDGASWHNDAADAIGEAFSNMDEFLVSYKESRIQPE